MKRSISLLFGLVLLGVSAPSAPAQNAAEVMAAYRVLEEKNRRMEANMEELQSTLEVLRDRLQAQSSEIVSLREELTRSKGDSVKPSQLDALAQEMTKTMNEYRKKDRELILGELNKLREDLLAEVRQGSRATPPPSTTRAPEPVGDHYAYTIEAGNTISSIVKAFRDQGVNVSTEDVLKANPGVRPTSLQPGQTIKIPLK